MSSDLVVHATFEDAYTDTDSDGLTDPLERQLGSDPTNQTVIVMGYSMVMRSMYIHPPLSSDSDGDSTVMQMRSPRVQIPTTLMIFLSI